jgi:hypothetical protein
VDAPKEGPEGPVRGGGLFLEQHAWTPHGLHHSLALAGLLLPLPAPEMPLPQQLLMVAEQPLSKGMGLREQGFTLAQWEAILKSALPIKIIIFSLQFRSEKAPRIIRIFHFSAKSLISSDHDIMKNTRIILEGKTGYFRGDIGEVPKYQSISMCAARKFHFHRPRFPSKIKLNSPDHDECIETFYGSKGSMKFLKAPEPSYCLSSPTCSFENGGLCWFP